MAPKLGLVPSKRERVEDTLFAHHNDLISLLSKYANQGKTILQPHDLLDGLSAVIADDQKLGDESFFEILKTAQEAIVLPPFVAIAGPHEHPTALIPMIDCGYIATDCGDVVNRAIPLNKE